MAEQPSKTRTSTQPKDAPSNASHASQKQVAPSELPPQARSGRRRSSFIGAEELKGHVIIRKCLAEFIGTAILVYVACGACVSLEHRSKEASRTALGSPAAKTVGIALAFGLTVATVAQALGHVSGAHLNPAVSIGLVMAGECGIIRAGLYTAVQTLGSIVGAVLIYLTLTFKFDERQKELIKKAQELTPEIALPSYGGTVYNADYTPALTALIIEALITFILVLTVCGVIDNVRQDVKGSAPLAIGFSITCCHLFAVPITGASMNPARSVGPALVDLTLGNSRTLLRLWVYWAGPLGGGALAGFLYRLVFKERSVFSTDFPDED